MSFLRQGLQQRLLQKLSPQQIQLMKLLQVPTMALEARIKEEIEQNPALEEGKDEEEEASDESRQEKEDRDSDAEGEGHESDTREDFDLDQYISDDEVPSYKTYANNTSPDDEVREVPISGGMSFQDILVSQLHMSELEGDELLIGEHLLGSLDDDGYLRRDLPAVTNDLAFSQNLNIEVKEVAHVLEVIQSFDPPGVGARDLRECLLLQLQRKDQDNKAICLAEEMLDKYMDEFSKKHYEKIMKQLNISEDEMKSAVDEILKLNPRPGNSSAENQKSSQAVIPDFILTNNDGILDLTLNSRNAPSLKVSRAYREMMEHYSKEKKPDKKSQEAILFVKQKLDAAKWFIDAIQQRQHTLLSTMDAIMNYQIEYFQEGDETKLRPMILKDIADIVLLDISTVSRVANSKYIQTHFGTFLLKSFFSESLTTESGEEVSSREVKKILQNIVEAENKKKPYTDQKLVKMLHENGYTIARRTVAKYREQLNIPVARMRKEI